jgi:hypothetical protein
MHIDRSEITDVLRSRGLDARADWVDRELPEIVDTHKNAALLSTLGIDLTGISPAGSAPQPG